MKKRMRYAAFLLLLALALPALAACGSDAPAEPKVSFDEMVAAVDAAVGNDGNMIAVDAGYIAGSMQMDVADYTEYVVKINGYGVNIDEYGIFKGADEAQVEAIQAAVETYFQFRESSWMDEYMPEEKPKLEAAEYRTVGNYVMYAILSDESKEAAFEAFEGCF